MADLRRRVLFRATLQDVVSSFFEHASRVRVEQRLVLGEEAAGERALHNLQASRVDGFRRLAYTHGGGTVPSQGMCTQGLRDCFSGFVKHRGSSRPWNP